MYTSSLQPPEPQPAEPKIAGRRRRAADDDDAAVLRLDSVESGSQKLRVCSAVDRAGRPFTVDVRFVPDFDRVRAQPCHAADKAGVAADVAVVIAHLRFIADDAEQRLETAGVRRADEARRHAGVLTKRVANLRLRPLHSGAVHQADGVRVQLKHLPAEFEAIHIGAARHWRGQIAIRRRSCCRRSCRRHGIAGGDNRRVKAGTALQTGDHPAR